MSARPLPPSRRDDLALALADAAAMAGAVLLTYRGCADARVKQDGSPVCSADLAADRVAKLALADLIPGMPIVSEETIADGVPDGPFILLDPLDGTREFLAGGDSYCVAIAVVEGGRPVAGAIVAPALGRAWYAGRGAWTRDLTGDGEWVGEPRAIHVRVATAAGPTALVSRFHGDPLSDAVLTDLVPAERRTMSSAVKFGLIAAGEADLNVRAGQTMAWDVAAGDAILAAAGGTLLALDGAAIDYRVVGRAGWHNPPFVAASSERLARQAVSSALARTTG